MDVYLDIAGSQIDGAREYQEDAFLTTYLDDEDGQSKTTALLVMADGMGGHAAGNIASQLVVNTFNRQFTARFGKEEVPKILREALDKGNASLRSSIKETPALDGMGSTMVTAAVSRGRLWWISVGDSHIYVIRDRELTKKNEDHSYGGYLDRMKAQGMEVEAEQGLSRNMLMSAMTGEEIAEVDCPAKPFQLLPGDRVILASDGLDTLSAGVILQTSLWSPTPKECVEALLKAVEDAKRPRQDNTTVIVCDVIKREGEPVSPPLSRGEREKRNKMGDTQPLNIAALKAELKPQSLGPDPAPVLLPPPAAPAPPVDALIEGPRSRLPMLIAALVLLLAAAGSAAWFLLLRPADVSPVPAPVATTTPAAPQEPEAAPVAALPVDTDTAPTDTPATPAEEPPEVTSSTETEEAPAAAEGQDTSTARTFRDSLKDGGEGPMMTEVPAGQFMMGTRGTTAADERPLHEVDVKAFAVSTYEVTFAEYDRFARATGRAVLDSQGLDRQNHPVFGVSWADALAYVQWLSVQTGARYRLPSEAQWEYAASAGTISPYWWGFELEQNRAHCFNCTPGLNPRLPTRVGSFEPNPFGLYDTVGNVAEWVHDCYHDTYRDAPTDGTVWEGGDCSVRVVRGGHYGSPTPTARKRDKLPPSRGYADVGFRVVRDL